MAHEAVNFSDVDSRISTHAADANAHHTKFTTTEHDTPDRHPNTVLKTAAGYTEVSIGPGETATVALNDYCFFPCVHESSPADIFLRPNLSTSGDTIARFGAYNEASADRTVKVRWRYITASNNPQIWVVQDPVTGEIKGIWHSDDPPEIETDNPFRIVPIQHYDKNGRLYGITNYIEIPGFLDEFRATLREGLAEIKKRYKLREKSTRPKLLPEHIRFCKLEKV